MRVVAGESKDTVEKSGKERNNGGKYKRGGERVWDATEEREGHKWEGTDPSVREREKAEFEREERRERVGVLMMDLMKREREKILEGTGSFVAAVYGRWCDKSIFHSYLIVNFTKCEYFIIVNYYSLIKSKPG
jgi:hypothetical protein